MPERPKGGRSGTVSRLRQRLWGLAVLSAIAVIVLPVLLDGSGSESRYQPVDLLVDQSPVARTERLRATAATAARVPGAEPPLAPATSPMSDPPTAWVVQAGAFGDEAAAIGVRDRLRATGLPSFVVAHPTRPGLFRVSVGPMIAAARAREVGNQVASLLGHEVQVVRYP